MNTPCTNCAVSVQQWHWQMYSTCIIPVKQLLPTPPDPITAMWYSLFRDQHRFELCEACSPYLWYPVRDMTPCRRCGQGEMAFTLLRLTLVASKVAREDNKRCCYCKNFSERVQARRFNSIFGLAGEPLHKRDTACSKLLDSALKTFCDTNEPWWAPRLVANE